jgi:hypothetical protein
MNVSPSGENAPQQGLQRSTQAQLAQQSQGQDCRKHRAGSKRKSKQQQVLLLSKWE